MQLPRDQGHLVRHGDGRWWAGGLPPGQLNSRAASAGHKRNDQKDYGKDQKHVSNPTRLARHPAETKELRNDGDDQKDDGIP